MHLQLERCEVRGWRSSDREALARHANNRKIWLNLRDAFPNPYSVEDADRYIVMAQEMDPETYFALIIDGEAAGAIGFSLHTDVERISAEIGYWLSEQHWGRGVTTEALGAVTSYAIERHGLIRLFATPFSWNAASARVLEKCGYQLEGCLRRSAIKDGQIVDKLMYAYVVP